MIPTLFYYLTLPSLLFALNPIEIKGSKFFDSVTGDQFFMKGVAYQPRAGGNYDPLADVAGCKRDIPHLKALGTNTIRVYETYSNKSHDECMKLLDEAGIYVLLDLPTPDVSIDRNQPAYDTTIYNFYKQKIDVFSKYNNVLGFFAGNEVNNDKTNTPSSGHVKAALRDIKAYIKTKPRVIPVGYANNDDPAIRKNVQDFFACGKQEDKADFYGINIYSWCGESDMQKSGYDIKVKEMSELGIPSILSEYGCNAVKPRSFGEAKPLYKEMSEVLSGGIVYEYSQEDNDYGLVKINGDKVDLLPDFEVVKKHYSEAKPKLIKKSAYTPETKTVKCPAISETWKASEKLPLTPSDDVCACALQSVECQINSKGLLKENGEKLGKIFGYTCANGVCDDVSTDTAKAVYGPFSFCNSTVRSSIIMQNAVNKGAQCDFEGFASKVALPSKKDLKSCPSSSKSEIQSDVKFTATRTSTSSVTVSSIETSTATEAANKTMISPTIEISVGTGDSSVTITATKAEISSQTTSEVAGEKPTAIPGYSMNSDSSDASKGVYEQTKISKKQKCKSKN